MAACLAKIVYGGGDSCVGAKWHFLCTTCHQGLYPATRLTNGTRYRRRGCRWFLSRRRSLRNRENDFICGFDQFDKSIVGAANARWTPIATDTVEWRALYLRTKPTSCLP